MHAFDTFRLAAIKTFNIGRRLTFGCKWTPRAGQAAALARKEAAALKHDCVQEIHFTIALGHIGLLGGGMTGQWFKDLGFEYERALMQAQAIVGPGTTAIEPMAMPFSEEAKRIAAIARRLSLRDGLWFLGTEHLFFALLKQSERLLRELVEAKGLVLDEYRTETEKFYREALRESLLCSKPIA